MSQYTPNSRIIYESMRDVRLQNKGVQIYQKICHNLTINVKKLSDGRRDIEMSFHRFLDNYSVTKQEIEKIIANQTNQNCKSLSHVLIVNDTTEVAFPTQNNKKSNFGPTGYFDYKGFFVHPNIVIDPATEEVLGIAGIETWKRVDKKITSDRAKKSIENKESYKWISSLKKGTTYVTNSKIKTFVTDRESDIYEYIYHVMNNKDYFILRASHDRKLFINDIDNNMNKISKFLLKQDVVHTYTIDLHETRKRKARKALLKLKYGEVMILKPKDIKSKIEYPEKIKLNIVCVEEDSTTSLNEKDKVKWLLLTNHVVSSINEAMKIVYHYKLRWTIEPMFASFKKKGLGIEDTQLEEFKKLEKLVLLGLNACVKIFYLVKCRNGSGKVSANIIFSEKQLEFLKQLQPKLEGKTDKQKNKFMLNSMAWAAWIIAKLGCWNGYNSTHLPGWQTMFDGLQKFNAMFDGWSMNA